MKTTGNHSGLFIAFTFCVVLSAGALVFPGGSAQAVPDQGMTSPTHRKNVGRIRFSTKAIVFKRERPSQFRSSFRVTDHIYGRAYMARSLGNTPHFTDAGHRLKGGGRGEWMVRVLVDGQEQRYSSRWFYVGTIQRKERDKYTTFQVSVNSPDNYPEDRKLRTNWARTVAKLAPGKHRVKVEVWSQLGSYRTRKPVATGTFTLIKRKGESLAAGRLPTAKMRSASLEAAVKSALRKRRMIKRRGDVRKVVISSAWQHGRYRRTRQRFRKLNATVVWRDKKGNGLCRFVTYKFVSDQRGGGWTPLRFRAFCMGCPEGWVRCR